jgi:hypothetical protein
MHSLVRSVALAAAISLTTIAPAHAGSGANAVLGGVLGATTGVIIGDSLGGPDGAIVGGALGGALGAAVATSHHHHGYYVARPTPLYVVPRRPVYVVPAHPVYVVPRGAGWGRHRHRDGYYHD